MPKSRSINKIGHALHDRDDVFERFSHGAALAALAAVSRSFACASRSSATTCSPEPSVA